MTSRNALRRRQLTSTSMLALVTLLDLLLAAATARGTETSFHQADDAYRAGRPAEAIGTLATLGHQTGWSEPLLYNLGNAYAQAGEPGEARLDYDRAALLNPRDADLAHNRELVLARSGQTDARSWLGRALALLSIGEWCGVLLAASWLLCAALAGLLLGRRFRRLAVAAALVLALGTAVSAAAVASVDARQRDAIVTRSHGTDLLLSPFDGATVESSVPEGARLRVDGEHAGFLHVQDGHDRPGWIESAAVERLLPIPS
jgi:tetratricopeptide (TPR) repeat protein